MNPLYNIIKSFIIDNNIYNKYISIINISNIKETNIEIYKILKVLLIYKKEHLEGTVSDFSLFFFSQYPAMKPDEIEVFISIFQQMEDSVISEKVLHFYLEAFFEKDRVDQIAKRCFEVSEGRGKLQDVIEYVKNIEPNTVVEESPFVTSDLQEIYEQTIHRPGLRWRLNTLNKMLGSLRQGNFGFVFARPEVGKTTFLASETTYMAEQLQERAALGGEDVGNILWVNNEEDGKVVMSRCYQASLGLPLQELYRNIIPNREEFIRKTGDRIRILDDANAGRKQIDLLCKNLHPRLIILDQIDKIKGFENDRNDLKLKDIYQWARELAKVYGPTIGTCQAGGTGEWKKWLQMNDVDSSHTAKQGEADFILGIGIQLDENYASERYLHLAKNKLPGDEDTLPALRHGKCPVSIHPEIARYSDKLQWDKK